MLPRDSCFRLVIPTFKVMLRLQGEGLPGDEVSNGIKQHKAVKADVCPIRTPNSHARRAEMSTELRECVDSDLLFQDIKNAHTTRTLLFCNLDVCSCSWF
jgi:hypothetical protein